MEDIQQPSISAQTWEGGSAAAALPYDLCSLTLIASLRFQNNLPCSSFVVVWCFSHVYNCFHLFRIYSTMLCSMLEVLDTSFPPCRRVKEDSSPLQTCQQSDRHEVHGLKVLDPTRLQVSFSSIFYCLFSLVTLKGWVVLTQVCLFWAEFMYERI